MLKLVIDCFMYCDETDVLKIRLEELQDIVDYFVISEANLTHSGKPKEFLLEKNLKKLNLDSSIISKIIICPVDLKPFSEPWERENHQRISLKKFVLKFFAREHFGVHLNIHPDSLVLVSDCDEIPRIESIKYQLRNIHKEPLMVYKMLFFYYNFKWMKPELCHGTTGIRWKNLLQDNISFQTLRDGRQYDPCYNNAGWQLSYFGTPEKISKKIQSIAHTEFNRPEYYDIDSIQYKIENGIDLFDRDHPLERLVKTDINNYFYLPSYLIKNKDLREKYL